MKIKKNHIIFISSILTFISICFNQVKATNEIKDGFLTRLHEKVQQAKLYTKNNNLNSDYCILVDMSIHSGKKRLFVWSFKEQKILYSSLCSHGVGEGSTQEHPIFSNKPGSYCTSLGKYKIGARAYSNYGINIHYKLHGLESTNNNAYKRIVVLHSYSYVPESEIFPEHLPMGYSLGCPVISNKTMTEIDAILQTQKTPILLWIYN